jgi:hypothetical protein
LATTAAIALSVGGEVRPVLPKAAAMNARAIAAMIITRNSGTVVSLMR